MILINCKSGSLEVLITNPNSKDSMIPASAAMLTDVVSEILTNVVNLSFSQASFKNCLRFLSNFAQYIKNMMKKINSNKITECSLRGSKYSITDEIYQINV